MAPRTSSSCPTGMFTAAEREFIRRELGMRFGGYPAVAEGIFLRLWRSGPRVGQPKLPQAVETMMARGLVALRTEHPLMPRAFFTEAGLAALQRMAMDRRALDPVRHAHIRQELGLESEAAGESPLGADLHDSVSGSSGHATAKAG